MDTNLTGVPGVDQSMLNFIPEKWRADFLFLFGLSVVIGRVIQALRNGGGLKGVVSSVWLGTNQPKGAPTGAVVNGTSPSGAFAGIGLIILMALVSLALFTACVHLAAGADPLVVRSEQSVKAADSSFELVLRIDNADRGFWKTNAPAFHKFATWLRTPVLYGGTNVQRCIAMVANVDDLKLSYQVNKTAAGSNDLYLGLLTMEAAAAQSGSWLNIVTNRTH